MGYRVVGVVVGKMVGVVVGKMLCRYYAIKLPEKRVVDADLRRLKEW